MIILKTLRVKPTIYVEIVMMCLKLSFFSSKVPDFTIKYRMLSKSNICKQPAITKTLKHKYPTNYRLKKVDLQYISDPHKRSCAVPKF